MMKQSLFLVMMLAMLVMLVMLVTIVIRKKKSWLLLPLFEIRLITDDW